MFGQMIRTTGRLRPLASKQNVVHRYNSTVALTQAEQEELSTAKPYEDIPGPKPLPLIGNVWRFLPYIGNLGTDFESQFQYFHNNYGTIVKVTGLPGRNDLVALFNADDIQKVFRNEGPWPLREGVKSGLYYRQVLRKDIFGGIGGALLSQGEEWHNFRTRVNQVMLQPRSIKLYIEPIDAVAEDFMKRIRKIRNKDLEMPNDFDNELCKWALESVMYIALDTRLGCLSEDLAPDSETQKMIDAVQILFESIYILDFRMSPWRIISTPQWRKFVKSSDFFTGVCIKYITEAMERLKSLPPDSDRELTIVEKILARDPNSKTAVVMAIDMMSAGVDTTSFATAFALYYLAVNPDKQEKVYQEISNYIKGKDQPLTSEILSELKYLKACIKESMRLRPVALGVARTLTKDIVLSGYRVRKGCDTVMPAAYLSSMEQYFPQADKFIPERWLKDSDGSRSEVKGTHPFAYLPFGFGARMCLGKRFAELEMETLLVKIIKNFRIEFNHEMQVQCKLLVSPKTPLKFKFIDRE